MNLDKIANHCMEMLDNIGIPYNAPTDIQWDKAKRRWGCCHRKLSMTTGKLVYDYRITITNRLNIDDDANVEEAVTKVMLHELLHTCNNCWDHTGKWKRYANKVAAELGYDITRTDDENSLNIKGKIARDYKYIMTCKKCGTTWKRYKASDFVRHPEFYRCQCGGEICGEQLY